MAKKYAYFLEKNGETGIVDSWEKCKNIVQKEKARYKSFPNENEAQVWLDSGANYESKKERKKELLEKHQNAFLEDAVYFDAGTGRGRGVEVRVTNARKESLLSLLLTEEFQNFLKKRSWIWNEFDNIEVGKEKTNNFGELLGLYLAMECAKKLGVQKIFGDSDLVLKYWSRGHFHSENLEEETVSLIQKVIENRKKFESVGGEITHISGDINPADLGFHKS